MIENIRLSFQGIWSHKMRSFLTMLGIIIGIASIIAIVSTIKGTNEQIKQNLIGSGNNTVEIKLTQGGNQYMPEYYGLPSTVPILTEEIRQEILAIDEVENVSYVYQRSYSEGTYYGNTMIESAKVNGIDENYFKTCGYIINSGRGFIPSDYSEYRKVVIINKDTVTSYFQDVDPIGQTLDINGEPFTIIGVVEKSTVFEPVINSMEDYYTYMEQRSAAIYMPSTVWPMAYNYDERPNVIIKAVDTNSMSNAGRKAADLINQYLPATEGETSGFAYKAADLLETAKNLQELSAATNQQLIWIASISLLVGGIGVMNIMLVSVTERTSEIGLKKAIGARKKRILVQFLTEAAVLTSLGGLLGVIAGIILAEVISKISTAPVAISVPVIIGSVLFSAVIGIVFGLLPSVKASNLNPIEALRHE